MASNLKYRETVTKKIAVKGILSGDGSTISYKDEDKNDCEITVADLLKDFRDQPIDFAVSLKTEEDLLVEDDE